MMQASSGHLDVSSQVGNSGPGVQQPVLPRALPRGGSRASNKYKYKYTKTCRHWVRGRCDLGISCNFAHRKIDGPHGEEVNINANMKSRNFAHRKIDGPHGEEVYFNANMKSRKEHGAYYSAREGHNHRVPEAIAEREVIALPDIVDAPGQEVDVGGIPDLKVLKGLTDPMEWLASANTPRVSIQPL